MKATMLDRKDDGTYLFVTCPFGGTEVFMKNLRSYVESRKDVAARWLEIPRPVSSGSGSIEKLFDNWTLRASIRTASAIRELRRNGTIIRGAFFNHLTAVSLLPYRKSIPSILSLDITPVLLNRDTEWYRHEGFRTKGFAERLSRSWTSRTYAAMRYLLPWSQFAGDSLVADYGVAPDRIMVQPPGIDLSFWKPADRPVERVEGRLTVLFVGGDFVRKGGDTLLELAAGEAFRDVEFHFVTGPFSGRAPANVHIHQGVLPNSRALLDLYETSDVFVLPTRADYTPNVVVEALAMGLPVITTNVGGLWELVREGNDGFIIPPSAGDILGNRLLRLKSNPALLQQFKRNARKHAENTFDIGAIGARIVDLLREVGRPGRAPHVKG